MKSLTPPDWLTERAQELFMEVVVSLGDKALPSDRSVIAEFAQAQADCEQWTQEVRFEGEVLYSDKGNAYANPKYTNLQARRKDLERYRDDLGMTPKARKVGVSAPSKGGLKAQMKSS